MPKLLAIWQRKMLEITVIQAHLMVLRVSRSRPLNIRDFVCEPFTIRHGASVQRIR